MSNMLGFSRTTEQMMNHYEKALNTLVRQKIIEIKNEIIYIK